MLRFCLRRRQKFQVLLACASALFASNAAAINVDVVGYGGYQIATIEHQKGGGFEAGAFVQTTVTRLGTTGLYVGAGLKYAMLSYKTADFGVDIDVPEFGLQTGLAIPFGGRKQLKVGLEYDLGLGGTVKWTPASGEKSADLSQVTRLNHPWLFEFPVGHESALGLGVTWFTSTFKASGFNGQIDANGYTLTAALSVGY